MTVTVLKSLDAAVFDDIRCRKAPEASSSMYS